MRPGAQAGGEGGGLNGTPGEAQAAGGVMRVQSRPPPPAKQFETPRRTVKPFTEVEVETLVEVRALGTGYSGT